jgi:hypothetical protein
MQRGNGMHRFVLIVSVLGLLTSCVTSQSANQSGPTIEAVKAGDHNLSCEAIRTEMAEMDGYIRESEKVETERQRDTTANTAGATAAGYALPMGGLLYNLGLSQPKANEWATARERGGQATKRKEQLASLFNQRRCV